MRDQFTRLGTCTEPVGHIANEGRCDQDAGKHRVQGCTLPSCNMSNWFRARSLRRQQGVVLVVALFIVALVATMAYVMMIRLERDTHRTTLLLRNMQAEFYAQGTIDWAKETLRTNWLKQQGKQNTLVDITPIQSPVQEINGYKI